MFYGNYNDKTQKMLKKIAGKLEGILYIIIICIKKTLKIVRYMRFPDTLDNYISY